MLIVRRNHAYWSQATSRVNFVKEQLLLLHSSSAMWLFTWYPRRFHGLISAAAVEPSHYRISEVKASLTIVSIQKCTKEHNSNHDWRENAPSRLRVHADTHAENHEREKKITRQKELIRWNLTYSDAKIKIGSDYCVHRGQFLFRGSVNFYRVLGITADERDLIAVISFQGIFIHKALTSVCCS